MPSPPSRIDQPREVSRSWIRLPEFDRDAFGSFSERMARFMGTPAFLFWMTVIIVSWILWNTVLPEEHRFDPYPFQFLTLALSLQASYAAPFILLAQNRQDDRDRVALEQDRSRDERNLADTEYLTREVASLRLALREVTTRDYVRSELREVMTKLDEIHEQMQEPRHDTSCSTERGENPCGSSCSGSSS